MCSFVNKLLLDEREFDTVDTSSLSTSASVSSFKIILLRVDVFDAVEAGLAKLRMFVNALRNGELLDDGERGLLWRGD